LTGWYTIASGLVELFEFDYQLEMFKPAAQTPMGVFPRCRS